MATVGRMRSGVDVANGQSGAGALSLFDNGRRGYAWEVMATDAQVADARFQALFGRVASDPTWIERVSHEITEAIHRELSEIDDDELRAGTLASSRSVLTLMADMVRLGRPPEEAAPPPDAIEHVRQYIRHGVAIDTLLRAYHVGHSEFFENWVAGVHDEVADPEWLARAVELGAKWTFDYVQALSRGLVTSYSEERELWVRSAAAVRAETVRALLDGEPVDLHLAAQRLRYELDRHHIAYIVWCDEGSPTQNDYLRLESTATELAEEVGTGRPLVVAFGGQVVHAWVGSRAPMAMAIAGVPDSMRVAMGSAAHGVEGFRASHREAVQARRVAELAARRPGTVTRYEDVALTAVASVDMDLARDLVARELGPLAEQDDDTVRLAATLRVYLEEQASPRRTAQRLGVHENTVKNRVRTVREMLGHAPEQRVAELLVALRLARLTRGDAARDGSE
jgi:PucR C-terminal helix-turn-helix domain/GGDEF-like domain